MQFLEKNLEQIIYDTPNDKLRDRNLYIWGHKKRQVKIGNYGIADLITYERAILDTTQDEHVFISEYPIITIYELKQNKITVGALLQAIRYAKGIKHYLDGRKIKYHYEIRICLIGKEVDKGDFLYVTDFMDNLQVLTYDFNFDGITFIEHSGYKLIEPNFNNGK